MANHIETELTQLLEAIAEGDRLAGPRLFERIYDELHRMAQMAMKRERPDHTLQPTALVSEAYVRLFGDSPTKWDNRRHFYGAATEVMRRILIDHAREKLAAKRGGRARRMTLDPEADIAAPADRTQDILSLDEAISQFESLDPRKAEIVKLRFFAGLSIEEIATLLDVSEITVKRDWRYARAWLNRRHGGGFGNIED